MNRHIIRLLRPHQWLKNLFVFTPLFFNRQATDWSYAGPCIVAFAAFCLVASGIYCYNDILDAEADRLHPLKRLRSVVSGAVSKRTAYATMVTVWVSALAAGTSSCLRIFFPIPFQAARSLHAPKGENARGVGKRSLQTGRKVRFCSLRAAARMNQGGRPYILERPP